MQREDRNILADGVVPAYDADEEVACEQALGAGDDGIPACNIIWRDESRLDPSKKK